MSVKSNIDTLGQNRPASRPAGIYRYAYSCRGIRFTDGGETPVTITLNKEYGTPKPGDKMTLHYQHGRNRVIGMDLNGTRLY